jgi:DNA-binding transcriptional LysR family regulator
MKDFTLREIEAFAAIMNHGTVTRAADFLNVAQPGVSRLIAQLEAKAGMALFLRRKKRLVPTAEALSLFLEVERSFISAKEITRVARDLADLKTGRLRIGILPALGSGIIPSIVQQFLADHSDVKVTVNIRSTQTLIEWAGRNQVDLAIGVTSNYDNPTVTRRLLPAVPVVCVLPEGHELATLPAVDVRHLSRTNFISLLPSDPMAVQIEQLCSREGVRIPVAIETNLAATAIAFCREGWGVTVVDLLSALAAPLEGLIVKPFAPSLSISYSIYRQKGSRASSLTDALIDFAIRRLSRIIEREALGIQ